MELVIPVLTHVLTAVKISSTSIGCFSFIFILRLIENRRFDTLSIKGTDELVWKDFPVEHSNFLHVPWNEKNGFILLQHQDIIRIHKSISVSA